MYNTRQGVAHTPKSFTSLDAVDEETHGVTVSDHDDSHMFYFDRLAGWPLQLVEPSIMPELPRTQKLSCESTASEDTWCFDRSRPPFLIPLFHCSAFYKHPYKCNAQSWARKASKQLSNIMPCEQINVQEFALCKYMQCVPCEQAYISIELLQVTYRMHGNDVNLSHAPC